MTQDTLSALLDGECSERDLDQVLREFDRSPGIKSEFSRMWLAREARSVRIRRVDPGFADRILAALDQPETPRENVVPLRKRMATIWRPAAGLALAAGLGAVSVMVLRPAAQGPEFTGSTVASVASPGSLQPVAEQSWNQLDPAEAERLNGYLIAYSQSRAEHGMGSTLGYARYAAYTEERRPQRIQGPRAVTVGTRQPAR